MHTAAQKAIPAAPDVTDGIYAAGAVVLQSGHTFPDMRMAYRCFGTLNDDKSNVILYPTSFSAQHQDIDHMVGAGQALDPDKYFIIIADLFGNGLSSSPSNTPWPLTGSRYPNVTFLDAVGVQRRMLREVWGIERVALVYGWSMGAMQAYHWAAHFPDAVDRIAVVCGSARCAPHNQVFIDGARHALMADAAFQDGAFHSFPTRGMRALGRVYAGWALSQEIYREERWRQLGYSSLEDFLVRYWEQAFSKRDPADLLAQFWTWAHGDISRNDTFNGNLEAALGAIKARVLLMPGDHDLYFRVEDNRRELLHLQHGELDPIPSIWGHRAGNPVGLAAERAFINDRVTRLLDR